MRERAGPAQGRAGALGGRGRCDLDARLGRDPEAALFDLGADLHKPDSFYDQPYPSDLRLTAQGTPDLAGLPYPEVVTTFVGIRDTAMLHPGFPVIPVAYFKFSAPLAELDVKKVIPADKASPILLLDVDPASPDRGAFYPAVATLPPLDGYVPENLLAVGPRPGIVLHPGRKYAVVVILIIAAIVTPPDVMSQIILFTAIYPLYEVSIHIIRRMEKTREARLRAIGRQLDEEAARLIQPATSVTAMANYFFLGSSVLLVTVVVLVVAPVETARRPSPQRTACCRPLRPPPARPRGPRRDGRPGDRPGADRRGGPRRPTGAGNVAPADGSDKPAEATGADAPKTTVKRVRKVVAPAAGAADGKGE